jgi:signal transduction histidine kinase
MEALADTDSGWLGRIAASLAKIADELPVERTIVAAVCDETGRASDVVVRGPSGNAAFVLGLPETGRPALAPLLASVGDDLPRADLPGDIAVEAAAGHGPLADEQLARSSAPDLAAPLRAVAVILEAALARPIADRELAEMLAAAVSTIEGMRAMVEGAVGGEAELERAPVEMNALLYRVLEALAAEIGERGAHVTCGPLPTVAGDEAGLERVLATLLSNALRFAGEHPPRVRVSVEPLAGEWRFSVADEGLAIAAGGAEDLFALAAGAAGDGRRGIGLATCRRIIERHGGRMWVEPHAPRGAVFRFTIPDGAR